MKIIITFLFAIICIIYVALYQFFPDWTLKEGYLITLFHVISIFSFFGLFFCIALLLNIKKGNAVGLGVLFTVLFVLLSLGEIYPIDTTTNPVDILTLQIEPNGQKVIVRKYINAKTTEIIHDTVRVKDYYVFRKFINK